MNNNYIFCIMYHVNNASTCGDHVLIYAEIIMKLCARSTLGHTERVKSGTIFCLFKYIYDMYGNEILYTYSATPIYIFKHNFG